MSGHLGLITLILELVQRGRVEHSHEDFPSPCLSVFAAKLFKKFNIYLIKNSILYLIVA